MLPDKLKKIFCFFQKNEGLSLVEVLVAVSLSSIVMIIVYSANRTVIFSIKNLSGVVDFYQQINLAQRRIDSDINSLLYDSNNKSINLIGEINTGISSGSKITFVTINSNDFFVRKDLDSPTYDSDVKQISYYLKTDPQFPDVNFLIRKETILYNKDNDEITNSSEESVILTNVKNLKFEYSLRSSWQDKWDSSQTRRFPKSVKTVITLMDFQNREHVFEFISNLEMIK